MDSESENPVHFGRSIANKWLINGEINPVYQEKRSKNNVCVDKIRRNRSELIEEMKKIIGSVLNNRPVSRLHYMPKRAKVHF